MSGTPRRGLGIVGALALVVSLMVSAAPAAVAEPASSDATTVEVTGRIVTVQTESPYQAQSEGEQDHAGDESGHDDAEHATHEEPGVLHVFETEDGRLLDLDDSLDALIDTAPPPAAKFEGELVVPDKLVEAVEEADGTTDTIAEGATLTEGTPEAEVALDALLEDPAPATIASGSITPASEPAAAVSSSTHHLYVAIISNRGDQPDQDVIDAQVEAAADYWEAQGNGAITMSRVQTQSYAATAATSTNRCGYAGGHTDVWNEAAGQFPEGIFNSASSANHLIVIAPRSCALRVDGSPDIGLGSVGASFASGGLSITTSLGDSLNTFKFTLAHELGHNLGFHHAHGLFCSGGSCSDEEYADLYSVMGFSVNRPGIPALNTLSREYQGILDPGEITQVSTDRKGVPLWPRSTTSGVRAIKVVDSDGSQYYIELRSGTDADQGAYQLSTTSGLSFPVGVTVQQVRNPCIGNSCGFRTLLYGYPLSGGIYRAALQQDGVFTTSAGTQITVASIASGFSSADIDIDLIDPLTATPTPKISGTARVGSKLTAKPGSWGPAPVTLKYQWLRNGKAIKGATKSTYTLKAADRARKISVRVAGLKSGYTGASKTSAATKTVAAGRFKAAKPKIVGVKKVGKTLRVKPGSWSPKAKMNYRWLRNGKAIKGATKSTYRLTSKDRGKRISVRVVGSKSGYAKTVKLSSKTVKVRR